MRSDNSIYYYIKAVQPINTLEFRTMIKKSIIFTILVTLVLSLTAAGLLAQGGQGPNGKHKNSPFLITGKLPHLTKMLMQQWENPTLKLTDEQKEKLIVVRKDTIGGAKKLGKEIGQLEQQVVDGLAAGKSPEELKGLVDQVATLKSQATMLHLACIVNTRQILDKEQLAVLTGKAAH
jgi:hypothetical protein